MPRVVRDMPSPVTSLGTYNEAALSPGPQGFRVSPGLESAPGRGASMGYDLIGIFLGWMLICGAWELFGYLAPG